MTKHHDQGDLLKERVRVYTGRTEKGMVARTAESSHPDLQAEGREHTGYGMSIMKSQTHSKW